MSTRSTTAFGILANQVEQLNERIGQVEAQLACARHVLDLLEAASLLEVDVTAMAGHQEDAVYDLMQAISEAHNRLDDCLEWPSERAMALLDCLGACETLCSDSSCNIVLAHQEAKEALARWSK
jgi:hypothetical protein